jgi:putative MFS transporter
MFYHPIAFWLGCLAIIFGVASHFPMFLHSASMGYHMAGMPMSPTMLVGMAMIPIGLLMSGYGLMPRSSKIPQNYDDALHFHVADGIPLNIEHWKLVAVLFVAVAVDVMKPATLGFVMPGMSVEYKIGNETVGVLVLVALTGTVLGSVLWGYASDVFGRRATILLSALMFIGTAICGAMPSFNWNLIMCFLMGMSAGGLLPITFALMAESVPAAHRGWLLVALGGLGTGAGYVLASGSAAILEPLFSWRSLWLLGLPTGLFVIMLNRYIPESPRYLARMGMRREAREVLARFCGPKTAVNVAPVVEDSYIEPAGGLLRLLTGQYRGVSTGLIIAGLAWGVVNFGFLLWLPTNLRSLGLGHEADVLMARSALIALPCIALVIWLYHRWNSIYSVVLFLSLTGLSLLVFCLLDWFSIQSVTALSAATAFLLMSASGVIAMLIPYAAEIFPVELRGTGTGMIAASSKLGGIIGAILGMLGLFGSIALSALLLAVILFASAIVLLREGIDTRGLRLEDIQTRLSGSKAI